MDVEGVKRMIEFSRELPFGVDIEASGPSAQPFKELEVAKDKYHLVQTPAGTDWDVKFKINPGDLHQFMEDLEVAQAQKDEARERKYQSAEEQRAKEVGTAHSFDYTAADHTEDEEGQGTEGLSHPGDGEDASEDHQEGV